MWVGHIVVVVAAVRPVAAVVVAIRHAYARIFTSLRTAAANAAECKKLHNATGWQIWRGSHIPLCISNKNTNNSSSSNTNTQTNKSNSWKRSRLRSIATNSSGYGARVFALTVFSLKCRWCQSKRLIQHLIFGICANLICITSCDLHFSIELQQSKRAEGLRNKKDSLQFITECDIWICLERISIIII